MPEQPGTHTPMAGLGSSFKLNSPSAGPSAARIDHLNRQVAELVAKNKESQARAASLERDVQTERERGEQAMREVEAKWRAERGEWTDTVEFIQGAHEIAHLRTRDDLHAARIAVMVEQDRVLKERARTVRKEFNLTLSLAKERDLQRDLALATVRHIHVHTYTPTYIHHPGRPGDCARGPTVRNIGGELARGPESAGAQDEMRQTRTAEEPQGRRACQSFEGACEGRGTQLRDTVCFVLML